MQATYQHSWLWFLIAILMVPIAYGQDETILGAYFMNGNTDAFSSRIYLWNPSDSPGDVTVRVFTLPLTSGTTQELTTEPLALGTLGAKSAFNIKLAEDILTPIGVSIPYTTDGGNLTLEFTIGAAGVQGVAQVFSGDFAFGTYPLQVISESTGTNTATGFEALLNNATGSENTATGYQALLNNTTGNENTATGFRALWENTTGRDNVATGNGALSSNTTGSTNTAVGNDALRANTTGTANTASGNGALSINTTGSTNTAVGNDALRANTTGTANTASGNGALSINATGSTNTATGSFALASNATGNTNTATGAHALLRNITGSNNTATGNFALVNNTTGIDNVATGFLALENNTTGSNNIAVGRTAGSLATTGDNNIYIGNNGVAAESNFIRIGDVGHTAVLAGVQVVPVSSRRFKEDIHDMGEASTSLMRLRPVSFRYKEQYDAGDRRLHYGLIAEEVAEVYPELVVYDDQGRAKTVMYQQLPAIMLNELQKQHRQVQELTERLTRLEQVLTEQQTLATVTN